jgi:transposase InsO family protein
VERVLGKNRTIAEDLKAAQQQLYQIVRCLRYSSGKEANQTEVKISSEQVAQEIDALIHGFRPTGKLQRAQIRLFGALKKRWGLYAHELLYCYDIPGLPQDNLYLESLFGRLRRHQRRISGRKSTQELNVFGQAQVLFMAKSAEELLQQIQLVPRDAYLTFQKHLANAELPRQFFRRLHHDPLATMHALVCDHSIHGHSLK